jgi:hypothetical protein
VSAAEVAASRTNGRAVADALAQRDQARLELTAATSHIASLERDSCLRREVDEALGQLKATRKKLSDAEEESQRHPRRLEQARGERDADRRSSPTWASRSRPSASSETTFRRN